MVLLVSLLDGKHLSFEKIKKFDPDAKTFLMTAYQDDPRLYDAKAKGVLHVFEKPFSLRDLKEMFARHLGRGSPQRI